MNNFTYTQPKSIDKAVALGGRFIAGGTTLVDLMKLGVETPPALVDVTELPLAKWQSLDDGGLRIGAMVRNSDLANHHWCWSVRGAVAGAAFRSLAAVAQHGDYGRKSAATDALSLLPRPTSGACNKREPGSGCAAMEGHNRMMAVLGTSDQLHRYASIGYVRGHDRRWRPSIHVRGAKGERTIPIGEFYKLPGDTPHIENALQPGDLITHVELPPANTKQVYLKLRDRASYEFALASAAWWCGLRAGTFVLRVWRWAEWARVPGVRMRLRQY
jgi:xanthine dehydrogenase YagS FAD-binding subunit